MSECDKCEVSFKMFGKMQTEVAMPRPVQQKAAAVSSAVAVETQSEGAFQQKPGEPVVKKGRVKIVTL